MGGYESRCIVFVSGRREGSRIGEVSLAAEMFVLDVSKPRETGSISKRCDDEPSDTRILTRYSPW